MARGRDPGDHWYHVCRDSNPQISYILLTRTVYRCLTTPALTCRAVINCPRQLMPRLESRQKPTNNIPLCTTIIRTVLYGETATDGGTFLFCTHDDDAILQNISTTLPPPPCAHLLRERRGSLQIRLELGLIRLVGSPGRL